LKKLSFNKEDLERCRKNIFGSLKQRLGLMKKKNWVDYTPIYKIKNLFFKK
jgi:hypothetical protein